MPYPAADVEILDVEFETQDGSPISQGSNVEVEVDIRNNKNETGLGIVGVESPSSNNTILQTCVVLPGNFTDTIDESTADGTLDGEFSVLEVPKEVTVTVGGYKEEDFVGSCAGMTPADFETDSKTFMLNSCQNVKNNHLEVLKEFDKDNSGSISVDEVSDAAAAFQEGEISKEEINAIEFANVNNCSFQAMNCDKVRNNHLDVLREFDEDNSGDISNFEYLDADEAFEKGEITETQFKAVLFAFQNNCSFPAGSPNLTPSDATITNVVASGNGKTATIAADVTNNASVGIDVVVNITENNTQLAQKTVGVDANSTKNVQFSIDFDIPNNQQRNKTLCVEKGEVKPQ